MARTSAAAVALATVPERVSVLETKVDNIEEKLDDIKVDVKDMHDCLDRTRDGIMTQLEAMHKSSCDQHNELASKIKDLEGFKTKWVYMTAGAIATIGFLSGHASSILNILK
jgi:hypothetical protein